MSVPQLVPAERQSPAAFAFTPGRGKLNWRALGQLDVPALRAAGDVSALQPLLANVVGAAVGLDDLREQPDESLLRFVGYAQSCLEYMIWVQREQARAVAELKDAEAAARETLAERGAALSEAQAEVRELRAELRAAKHAATLLEATSATATAAAAAAQQQLLLRREHETSEEEPRRHRAHKGERSQSSHRRPHASASAQPGGGGSAANSGASTPGPLQSSGAAANLAARHAAADDAAPPQLLFRCIACHKVFKGPDFLDAHVQRRHGGDPAATAASRQMLLASLSGAAAPATPPQGSAAAAKDVEDLKKTVGALEADRGALRDALSARERDIAALARDVEAAKARADAAAAAASTVGTRQAADEAAAAQALAADAERTKASADAVSALQAEVQHLHSTLASVAARVAQAPAVPPQVSQTQAQVEAQARELAALRSHVEDLDEELTRYQQRLVQQQHELDLQKRQEELRLEQLRQQGQAEQEDTVTAVDAAATPGLHAGAILDDEPDVHEPVPPGPPAAATVVPAAEAFVLSHSWQRLPESPPTLPGAWTAGSGYRTVAEAAAAAGTGGNTALASAAAALGAWAAVLPEETAVSSSAPLRVRLPATWDLRISVPSGEAAALGAHRGAATAPGPISVPVSRSTTVAEICEAVAAALRIPATSVVLLEGGGATAAQADADAAPSALAGDETADSADLFLHRPVLRIDPPPPPLAFHLSQTWQRLPDVPPSEPGVWSAGRGYRTIADAAAAGRGEDAAASASAAALGAWAAVLPEETVVSTSLPPRVRLPATWLLRVNVPAAEAATQRALSRGAAPGAAPTQSPFALVPVSHATTVAELRDAIAAALRIPAANVVLLRAARGDAATAPAERGPAALADDDTADSAGLFLERPLLHLEPPAAPPPAPAAPLLLPAHLLQSIVASTRQRPTYFAPRPPAAEAAAAAPPDEDENLTSVERYLKAGAPMLSAEAAAVEPSFEALNVAEDERRFQPPAPVPGPFVPETLVAAEAAEPGGPYRSDLDERIARARRKSKVILDGADAAMAALRSGARAASPGGGAAAAGHPAPSAVAPVSLLGETVSAAEAVASPPAAHVAIQPPQPAPTVSDSAPASGRGRPDVLQQQQQQSVQAPPGGSRASSLPATSSSSRAQRISGLQAAIGTSIRSVLGTLIRRGPRSMSPAVGGRSSSVGGPATASAPLSGSAAGTAAAAPTSSPVRAPPPALQQQQQPYLDITARPQQQQPRPSAPADSSAVIGAASGLPVDSLLRTPPPADRARDGPVDVPAAAATYADREAAIDIADEYEAMAADAVRGGGEGAPPGSDGAARHDVSALSSFTSFPLPAPVPGASAVERPPSQAARGSDAGGAPAAAPALPLSAPRPRIDFGSTAHSALSGLSESITRPEAGGAGGGDDTLSPSLLLSSPENSLSLHGSTFVGGASTQLRPSTAQGGGAQRTVQPRDAEERAGGVEPHGRGTGVQQQHSYDDWDDDDDGGGDDGYGEPLASQGLPRGGLPPQASAVYSDGASVGGSPIARWQQPQHGHGAVPGPNGLLPGEEEDDSGAAMTPVRGGGAYDFGDGQQQHQPGYSPSSFDDSGRSHQFAALRLAAPGAAQGGAAPAAAAQASGSRHAGAGPPLEDADDDDDEDDEELAALLTSAGFPGGRPGAPAGAPQQPGRPPLAPAMEDDGVEEVGVVRVGGGGVDASPPAPAPPPSKWQAHVAGPPAPPPPAPAGGGMSRPHTSHGLHGAAQPTRGASSGTVYSAAEIEDIEDL